MAAKEETERAEAVAEEVAAAAEEARLGVEAAAKAEQLAAEASRADLEGSLDSILAQYTELRTVAKLTPWLPTACAGLSRAGITAVLRHEAA